MKKIAALILVAVMVLGLCACGQNEQSVETTAAASATGIQVGYSTMDITPKYSVPLGGYGNSSFRMSDGFLDYIYTTAIAISDGENTLILIENDLQAAVSLVFGAVRKKLSEKTGIPEENIMIGIDHIHSAPDLWNTAEGSIGQYTSELKDIMVKNALAAVEDMKSATFSYGEGTVENCNFVRHYVLEDGHVRGPNFGLQYNSPKVGHTHEPDRQMQVVKIEREGEKPIVLVNWQSHPQMSGGADNKAITADTVGAMRTYLTKEANCDFMYFLGASGDVMAVSLIDSDNVHKDYRELGQSLGEGALGILNSEMKPLTSGQVKGTHYVFVAEVDHSEDGKASGAAIVKAHWEKTNDFNACVELGAQYGINSPYHATGIITKGGLGKTGDVDMYAFAIGDLAFICAPYEMFCENGKYIKENSPFSATFVMTMANSSHNYISSAEGFDYNCYEANTCRYVKGTAEALAEQYVQLLDQLAAK